MMPKSFIAKKKKIPKDLLKKPLKFSRPALESLIEEYEQFLKNVHYTKAERIVWELEYSRHELQPFCDKLPDYEHHKKFDFSGIYLSALVNKIIKEREKIKLYLPDTKIKFNCIGNDFNKGSLIIFGDVGIWSGFDMYGGELIINGNSGENTGHSMKGGKLIVHGTADSVGSWMTGGELHAKKIGSIFKSFRGGEIYEDGKKLRG